MKCPFCFHYQYCREFFWALLSIFFPFKRFVSDINFPSAARVWSQRVACAADGFIISCCSVWEQEQIWRNEFEWIEQFSGAQTGGLFEWRVSRSLHRLGDGADIFIHVDVTKQFILSSPAYESRTQKSFIVGSVHAVLKGSLWLPTLLSVAWKRRQILLKAAFWCLQSQLTSNFCLSVVKRDSCLWLCVYWLSDLKHKCSHVNCAVPTISFKALGALLSIAEQSGFSAVLSVIWCCSPPAWPPKVVCRILQSTFRLCVLPSVT